MARVEGHLAVAVARRSKVQSLAAFMKSEATFDATPKHATIGSSLKGGGGSWIYPLHKGL